MMRLFSTTLADVQSGSDQIRRCRYGVIESQDGRLRRIRLRSLPKFSSLLQLWWTVAFGRHRFGRGNGCALFYNEPRSCPGFLALPWIVTDRNATLETLYAALEALDEVARVKGVHAIVCEVANKKISDRIMRRLGWSRHVPGSSKRHYIKRFDAVEPAGSAKQAVSAIRASIGQASLAN